MAWRRRRYTISKYVCALVVACSLCAALSAGPRPTGWDGARRVWQASERRATPASTSSLQAHHRRSDLDFVRLRHASSLHTSRGVRSCLRYCSCPLVSTPCTRVPLTSGPAPHLNRTAPTKHARTSHNDDTEKKRTDEANRRTALPQPRRFPRRRRLPPRDAHSDAPDVPVAKATPPSTHLSASGRRQEGTAAVMPHRRARNARS